jgi:hypothetical protein
VFAKKRLIWVLLALFLLTDAALFLSVLLKPPTESNANFVVTAQYLEQNPAPTPEFIVDYSTQAASNFDLKQSMSITISEESFARQGISTDKVEREITKNLEVFIDGNPVKSDNILLDTLTCAASDASLDSSKIRCWGGPIEIFFDVSGLSTGLHLASITTPDYDGVEHSYSWAFRYDPNEPTSDPNILPTPMILPSETPSA